MTFEQWLQRVADLLATHATTYSIEDFPVYMEPKFDYKLGLTPEDIVNEFIEYLEDHPSSVKNF